MESRFLKLVTLRLESDEYNSLWTESLVSDELYLELEKNVEKRFERYNRRLKFNLKSGLEERVKELPCLRGVPQAVLYDISMSMSIYFVFPSERIFYRKQKVKYVYFVSNGLFETHSRNKSFIYGTGDILGANELISNKRIYANYRAIRFGYLFAMPDDVFKRLIHDYPIVVYNLTKIDEARDRGNVQDNGMLRLGHTRKISNKKNTLLLGYDPKNKNSKNNNDLDNKMLEDQ